MKVLLSWLREFAPDIAGSPEELAETLSDLGLAVEELSELGKGLDAIVVAEVLATRNHPDADRIQLVDVDIGSGEALQVCCGAFNMQAGDKVPLATIGAIMPNGMEIARRKMRGEWSNGMLCSQAELSMGDDHGGIMILDDACELGLPIAEALGIKRDVLFDLEVNPNRPDAMSILGVARDLAARQQVPLILPTPEVSHALALSATQRAAVHIGAPDFCSSLAVRVLDNVPTGASPSWMANRLLALGQRPINAVVDISNYVMFELGQPNHTYDLDLMPEGYLGVRMAQESERLVTLDGNERTLCSADGVIVNSRDQAVGLAGVMGGASTEISTATRSVLLEAACWNPMAIARTARRLGLRSEASARFERGTDPDIIALALDRFVELAAAVGATTDAGIVAETGNRRAPLTVRLRPARANSILGTDLSAAEMVELLAPLGFVSEVPADETGQSEDIAEAGVKDIAVQIPSWRVDSATEIDVIEEIGRMHGYSRIARTVPLTSQTGALTALQSQRRGLRALLAALGITEAMPLPFLAPGDLARAGLGDDGIVVTNPLVAEESIMRTSLRPGLLKAVAYNAARRNFGVSFFEIGWVHPGGGGEVPEEQEHLGVVLAGCTVTAVTLIWQRLARHLALAQPTIRNQPTDGLHPGRSAIALAEGKQVGVLGEVDPEVRALYEIAEPVVWLELNLDAVMDSNRVPVPYRAPSRFPSSDIDLAFVVPNEVAAAEVAATITKAASDWLVSLRLFDVFRSAKIGDRHRSLAYTLRFESAEHTLTDKEVAAVRQACIDAVVSAHNATLRT